MSKVEFYQDKKGGWRWRVQAANGEIVATGEAHNSRADAERAYEGVKRTIADEGSDDAA